MAEQPSTHQTNRGKRRLKYYIHNQPTGVVRSSHGRPTVNPALPPLNCTSTGAGPGPGCNFVDRRGGVVRNVHVQLIFFGSAWAASTTIPSISQVTAAVQSILAGPYMSYLAQYGVSRGTLRGTTLVTAFDPLDSFPVAGSGASRTITSEILLLA